MLFFGNNIILLFFNLIIMGQLSLFFIDNLINLNLLNLSVNFKEIILKTFNLHHFLNSII